MILNNIYMLPESELERIIASIADNTIYWLPGLVGGIVDYVTQIQQGRRNWELGGFILHLASSIFFGWLLSKGAAGLEYNNDMVGAMGGFGGFLGVRVSEIIIYKIKNMKP